MDPQRRDAVLNAGHLYGLAPTVPPDELTMFCTRTPPAARRETPFSEHRGAGSRTPASASYEEHHFDNVTIITTPVSWNPDATEATVTEGRLSRTFPMGHKSPPKSRSRTRRDHSHTTERSARAKRSRLSAHAIIEAKDHREPSPSRTGAIGVGSPSQGGSLPRLSGSARRATGEPPGDESFEGHAKTIDDENRQRRI